MEEGNFSLQKKW